MIVMVSDWLELDASDSWVRHDSEIVSICPTRPPSVPQSPHTFRAPDGSLRLSVVFTRPCNKSYLTRHIWTCRP